MLGKFFTAAYAVTVAYNGLFTGIKRFVNNGAQFFGFKSGVNGFGNIGVVRNYINKGKGVSVLVGVDRVAYIYVLRLFFQIAKVH